MYTMFDILQSQGDASVQAFGQQFGLTPEQNADTANYIFSAHDVQSFLSARLFGAPISASMTSPDTVLASFAQFGGVPSAASIAAVAALVIAGSSGIAATAVESRSAVGFSRSQLAVPVTVAPGMLQNASRSSIGPHGHPV